MNSLRNPGTHMEISKGKVRWIARTVSVEQFGAVLTERHAARERDAERVGRVAPHFEAAAEAAAGMPSDRESARREVSRVLDRLSISEAVPTMAACSRTRLRRTDTQKIRSWSDEMNTNRLVDKGWERELRTAFKRNRGEIRIVCPFIKLSTVKRLFPSNQKSIRVVTRFSLSDFSEGVSDLDALRELLERGAAVRGVVNLHAKLYLFGGNKGIVTSANLTESALTRNREFGLITEDSGVVAACGAFFEKLWSGVAQAGGRDLTIEEIDDWSEEVARHRMAGGRPGSGNDLPDHGIPLSPGQAGPVPGGQANPARAFVKFVGTSSSRFLLTDPVFYLLEYSGTHWAVCYPKNKRPRNVKDGDVVFIGALTKGSENDIRIYGRAIAMAHDDDRDTATPEEIRKRKRKKDFPAYIRVHHAEFLAGTLENCVSLYQLMNDLDSDSFASTQGNAARGDGNTNPRRAYMQQPAVQLSDRGFDWLEDRLQEAFEIHGKLPQHELDKLDWSEIA